MEKSSFESTHEFFDLWLERTFRRKDMNNPGLIDNQRKLLKGMEILLKPPDITVGTTLSEIVYTEDELSLPDAAREKEPEQPKKRIFERKRKGSKRGGSK
ncbi:MAG: hypothetical protein O8C56_01040 [Candidatus Methanoperedens sp.]|nr:hypothetical protein [Candidatus Methanoperedens sp.]